MASKAAALLAPSTTRSVEMPRTDRLAELHRHPVAPVRGPTRPVRSTPSSGVR